MRIVRNQFGTIPGQLNVAAVSPAVRLVTDDEADELARLEALEAARAQRLRRTEISLLLLSGLGSVISLTLFASGREKTGYAFGIMTTVLGTVTAAVRLAEDS